MTQTVNNNQSQLQQIKKDIQPIHEQAKNEKVGNFIINYQQLLGEGSFSKVYKGHDAINNKFEVAIKVIQKSILNADLKHLIASEVKLLRLINHQNIVKCYEIIQDQKNIYIVMELCIQGDLQSKVDKSGPFSQKQALPIIKGVFKGLNYLAEQNIIHRDIKVANIFMHNGLAKIADFGFAVHNKSKKEFQDISIGSPIYMSPQGIKHNVYGPKTDVWAFGIFVYELIHGKTPYSHCTKEKQLKYNISNPLNWNSLKPDLTYTVKQLILKCLQVNYQKRVSFQKLKQFELFKQKKVRQHLQTQPLENQIQQIKQTINNTPNFKNSQRLQQESKYIKYCQNIEQEVSKISKNLLSIKELKYDQIKLRSKSKQTPRTRQQALSKQNKVPSSIIVQQKNHYYSPSKNAHKTAFQMLMSKSKQKKYKVKLKTQTNGYEMLQSYRAYYQNNEKNKKKQLQLAQQNQNIRYQLQSIKKCNQISIQSKKKSDFDQKRNYFKTMDNQLPFFGQNKTPQSSFKATTDRFNSPSYTKHYQYQMKKQMKAYPQSVLRNTERPPQSKIYSTFAYNFKSQHESFKHEFEYKSKNQKANIRNFTSLQKDEINYPQEIKVTKIKNKSYYNFKLYFPKQNLNCYLYLVHFSRLLYKLSCNLQQKPYLWQIRANVSKLCLQVLHQLRRSISLFFKEAKRSSRKQTYDPKQTQSLYQIKQTVQKYISQYQNQFSIITPTNSFNITQTNSKLQLQIGNILSHQLKSYESSKTIKMLYFCSVYLYHYKQIFQKYFENKASKYWFEYSLKNSIKQIQNDIEVSNSGINLEGYFKIKKKIGERAV